MKVLRDSRRSTLKRLWFEVLIMKVKEEGVFCVLREVIPLLFPGSILPLNACVEGSAAHAHSFDAFVPRDEATGSAVRI